MRPIPIFIGWDKRESVAYHVLCHSIIRRSSVPVTIMPLNRDNLGRMWERPRGPKDSTDFSNSRWLVPYLMEHKGWAIFMDCDMLCLSDIAELWDQRTIRRSVLVKQHNHVPSEGTKFLGQPQTPYRRKNWSSLMLLNTSECLRLGKKEANERDGLWLHGFDWIDDDAIGEIAGPWNHLVGVDAPNPDAKLVHYTLGGPWHGYRDVEYADAWFEECEHMLQGENPVAWRS